MEVTGGEGGEGGDAGAHNLYHTIRVLLVS